VNVVHPTSESSKQGTAKLSSAALRTSLNSDIWVWGRSSSIETIYNFPTVLPAVSPLHHRGEKWLLIIPGGEKENKPGQIQIWGLP